MDGQIHHHCETAKHLHLQKSDAQKFCCEQQATDKVVLNQSLLSFILPAWRDKNHSTIHNFHEPTHPPDKQASMTLLPQSEHAQFGKTIIL